MRAVSVRCPNCGASLDAAADAEAVTCSYCGTSARIQTRSRVWQVPARLPAAAPGAPVPVARQKTSWLVAIPLLITVACLAIPLVLLTTGKRLGPNKKQLGWWGSVPVLVDVDGDGKDDLIGFSRYVLDGDRMHLAAFSGVTGKKLWETPKLGTYMEVYQGEVAAAGDVVLLATQAGALRGFDRRTGAPRWEVQLGEKVKFACAGDDAGAIVVGTADDRWHRVALADGARTDAAAPRVVDDDDAAAVGRVRAAGGEREPGACDPLPSSERDGMPGLVTASSWSDLPAIEGMRVERIARRGGGPVIAFGNRTPGTAVPMVAALDAGGAVRWKAVIPASDPLNSRADDNLLTIGDDAVFAIYEPGSSSDEPPHLAAFALADGHRLWDVRVGKGTTIVMTALALAGGNVVLSSWGHLQAFDRATGAARFRLGQL